MSDPGVVVTFEFYVLGGLLRKIYEDAQFLKFLNSTARRKNDGTKRDGDVFT